MKCEDWPCCGHEAGGCPGNFQARALSRSPRQTAGGRFRDFREITARFDSQGACGHAIKQGEVIGYSKRHGCRCAGCWEKWKGENAAADQDDAFYSSQY